MRDNNDLGHPICDNLRAGDWMAGYTMNRLRQRDGTKMLGDVLSAVFSRLSKLPRYLNPCYFEAIISTVYELLTQSAVTKMGRYGLATYYSVYNMNVLSSLQLVFWLVLIYLAS